MSRTIDTPGSQRSRLARRRRVGVFCWTGWLFVPVLAVLTSASVLPPQVSEAASSSRAVPAVLTITTTTLPAAQATIAFSTTLSATGGVPPYLWTVGSGAVPPGLVLSSLGVLSGRPGKAGVATVNVRVTDSTGAIANASLSTTVAPAPPSPPPPERLVALDAFGDLVQTSPSAAQSTTRIQSPDGSPFAAIAVTPDGHGYYAATAQGSIAAGGEVVSLGSIARHLAHPVVAIALDPIGSGYWMVTSAGHVYGFGDAHSYGSMPRSSKQKIVGIAPVARGSGYWLVSASGRVTPFGSASPLGSVRTSRLRRDRIVAVAASTIGAGYELASRDGKLFSFGVIRTLRLPSVVTTIGQVAGIASVQGSVGFFVVGLNGTVASLGGAQSIAPMQGLSVAGVAAGA